MPVVHYYFDFSLGYQECMSETMQYMVEVEGHFPREGICVRLINHLQKHCESLSHTVPVQQSSPSTIQYHRHDNVIQNPQVRSSQYSTTKINQEINNNSTLNLNDRSKNCSDSDNGHKYPDNAISYKYKNDIKLRFSQDLNAVEGYAKKQKMELKRRNSTTSTENNRYFS